MVERYTKQDYRFPHVRFNEETLGPEPVATSYRKRIGIVGPFNFGPTIAEINSREQLRALFGEDSSPGSVAVQQAMLQGATEFTISRVLPTGQKSNGSISLVGHDELNEPVVGENPTSDPGRTIGLKFHLNYKGFPQEVIGTASLGASVRTPNNTDPVLYDSNNSSYIYNGLASVRYKVLEALNLNDYWDSENSKSAFEDNSLTVEQSALSQSSFASGKTFLLELDNNALKNNDSNSVEDINTFVENAKPGTYIQLNDTDQVEVKSYSWLEDGKIKLFVKSESEISSLTFPLTIFLTTSSNSAPQDDDQYFILGVRLDEIEFPQEISNLDESIWNQKIEGFYNFLVVKKDDNSLKPTYLLKDNGSSEFEEIDIGVPIQFGSERFSSVGNLLEASQESFTGKFLLNQGAEFVVNTISTTVSVGEPSNNSPDTDLAFEEGKKGSEIIEELEDAILTNPVLNRVLDDVDTQVVFNPISLYFSSSIEGVNANRFVYMLERFVSDDENNENINDVRFLDEGNSQLDKRLSFKGGKSSSKRAKRTFYDRAGNPLVQIEALNTGEYGNSIKVSVKPVSKGSFIVNVDVDDSTSQISSESISLDNRNIDENGRYLDVAGSNLITARFLPVTKVSVDELSTRIYDSLPQRLDPPSNLVDNKNNSKHPDAVGPEFLEDVPLVGGYEPVNAARGQYEVKDYEAAVDRLEGRDIYTTALVGFDASQEYYLSVVNKALIQAENSSPFNGLRTVAVAAPPVLNKKTAERVSRAFDSDRLSIVAGWSTFTGNARQGRNKSNPVGYYVGVLSANPPQVSPSGAGSVSGILSVSLNSRPDFLDTLTRLGIDAVYFDNSSKSYKILNGRTTSSDSVGKWISLRKVTDHIISSLYKNLSWARSQPNTPETRDRLATAADAFLEQLVQEGKILGFNPSVSNSSNNTNSGIINVTISFTPIFPADIISVGMNRNVTSVISLS